MDAIQGETTTPPTQSFAVAATVTSVSQAIRFSCTALAWSLMAKGLGPRAFGQVQLAYVVPMWVAMFTNAGLPVASVYFLGQNTYSLAQICGLALSFSAVGSTFAIIALWSGHAFLAPLIKLSTPLYIVVLAGVPVQLLYSNFSAVLLGQRRFTEQAWVNIVQAVGLCSIAVPVVFLHSIGPVATSAALVGATGVTCGAQLWFVRGAFGWRNVLQPPPLLLRQAMRLGIRGYLANCFQFLNYRFDIVIVSHFVGQAALGLYAVAYTIAEMLWQIPQVVTTVLWPTTAASKWDEANVRTARILRLGVLMSLVCGLACFILTPLVPKFLGSRYHPSVALTWMLLPGAVAMVWAKIIASDLNGRGYPEYASRGSALGFVLAVGLDIALIPHFGVAAAALISSAVYIIQTIYFLTVFRRVTHVSLDAMIRPRFSDLAQFKDLRKLTAVLGVSWKSFGAMLKQKR